MHSESSSAPSWEDVQRLLTNTEGDRPTSIRDRAILMRLAVYGVAGSIPAMSTISQLQSRRNSSKSGISAAQLFFVAEI